LILIPLIFWGCTPPPISVLYLTDAKFSNKIVQIDNSTYFLEYEYDLEKFSQRIRDSLITYFEIQDINNEFYTFEKMTFVDSTFLCYNNTSIDTFRVIDIKSVQLSRASTSEEKSQGWTQVIVWSLIGFVSDLNSKGEEESLSFKGTAIGTIVGLSLGSLFFFDNNKVYETIYFKHI